MKTLIAVLLVAFSTIVSARKIENVETESYKVNFHSRKISSLKFKRKGLKLVNKIIKQNASDFKLKIVPKSKSVRFNEVKVKVQYSRFGKVLVAQTLVLNRYDKKVSVRTVYYGGFYSYKLQLDGVSQTFEHNPDSTNINVDNSNSNVNKNVNKTIVK